MKLIRHALRVIPVLLALCPVMAGAQAVSVVSSGQDATDCSMAATLVSRGLPLPFDAMADCERALESLHIRPRDLAATYANRGILRIADNKLAGAIEDFNRALSIMPDLAEAYVGRGNATFLSGDPGKAADDYSQALDLQLAEAHIGNYNLGLAFEKLGNLALAETHYRQALSLQPDWELARVKLDAVLALKQAPPGP